MVRLLLLLALAASGAEQRVEQAGLRIDVSVRSQIYTWTVTNAAGPAVVQLELGVWATYNPEAPDGWQIERERDRLVAWTDDPRRGIQPGHAKTFSARTGSAGGPLGLVTVKAFRIDGQTDAVEGVWGPVRKRRSMALLVAGVLTAIAVIHATLIVRRSSA